MGWVVNATPRPLYPWERPGTHCIGGWLGPRAGLDRCGKSRSPIGIRSRDRPASSESLYRLSYPGPQSKLETYQKYRRSGVWWNSGCGWELEHVSGLISLGMEQNVIRWPESSVFHKIEVFTQNRCIVCNWQSSIQVKTTRRRRCHSFFYIRRCK
jgi:hypothetical protein